MRVRRGPGQSILLAVGGAAESLQVTDKPLGSLCVSPDSCPTHAVTYHRDAVPCRVPLLTGAADAWKPESCKEGIVATCIGSS